MNTIYDWLRSVPLDKYWHLIGSVVIIAALHWFVGPWEACAIAVGAHVVKKVYDYAKGLRDWADLIGDCVAGLIGALLGVACI